MILSHLWRFREIVLLRVTTYTPRALTYITATMTYIKHPLTRNQGVYFFMQVKGIIREFLVNLSIKSYSKRTIKSYRNDLTRFFDQINETELENITALSNMMLYNKT